MVRVPSAYTDSYERARRIASETADNYIRHTHIGDPVMDGVVDDLVSIPRADASRFIRAGMEQRAGDLRSAPKSLRDFFVDLSPPDPPWLDHDAFAPGIRGFHANVPSIFAAFVTGTLIDGFSTLIAKSFVQTGRIFDAGVRRLRQNNRHQVEIFMPGGLRREGDGWKLSVRIRLVHAQVRRLLRESGEWDDAAFGTPLSAAHLGFAIACFSARTAEHARSLGATFTPEEREGFCAVWRYAGHLMGIPDTILFANREEALHLHKVGRVCEPPPTEDSIIMANALINSAAAGRGNHGRRRTEALVYDRIYPISRALIGEKRADELRFPKSRRLRSLGILYQFRLDLFHQRMMRRFVKKSKGESMSTVFSASLYDESGLTYDLPDHAHAERSTRW